MSSPSSLPHDQDSLAKASPRRATGLEIAVAVLLVVLGFVGVLLPIEMSVGVVIIACWLLIIGAVVQLVDAFRGTGGWQMVWRITVAAAYMAAGLYLRFHLGIGLVALTLALITFFVVQGLIDILVYFRLRKLGGQGWLLMHGIVTLVLALMIWRHWPNGAAWVLGAFVGLNMMLTGAARLMLAIASRRRLMLLADRV